MERTVSATEARAHFGEMMRRAVEDRETIIVERSGKPQVVLLSMGEYERLRTVKDAGGTWQELLQRARESIEADLGKRPLPPPEVVIRQMREERDEQLWDALR
jgi:prevent-host-death family protein